jgi:2-phospho-L-lactate transferase/gluconeogenesis factor (CofD/UPF0052 family)
MINIALFSGGRGTGKISRRLLQNKNIHLSLIINAYDDGLSTGRLRSFIPGMLGPSDFRKNISILMPDEDSTILSLKKLIEYRLPVDCTRETGLSVLDFFRGKCYFSQIDLLNDIADNITVFQFKKIKYLFDIFTDYLINREKEKGEHFGFSDVSLGNILFAGYFLENNFDFNKTIKDISIFCKCRADIFNVTQGENLVLTALSQDGTYFPSESAMVEKHDAISAISEIFLLPMYLDENKCNQLLCLEPIRRADFLKKIEIFPQINPDVENCLKTADMIIYGPGTQHSSLFPSYLTLGLAEAISFNKLAYKVFISNIAKDNDIFDETAGILLKKFFYYFTRKSDKNHLDKLSNSDMITHAFIQSNIEEYANNSIYVSSSLSQGNIQEFIKINSRDWEDEAGRHHGNLVVRELINLIEIKENNMMMKTTDVLVSIIVPALNEENTVQDVLRELKIVDFNIVGASKEIILVDGGSIDNTVSLAETVEGIRVLRLPVGSGYGDAVRAGINACRGEIIALFPSDGEYNPNDLITAFNLINNGANIVFGSRLIKCSQKDKYIKIVYRNKKILYYLSKYGGLLFSFLCMWRYGKFIGDPLTSIKVFRYKLIHKLSLKSRYFDIIGEIISKCSVLQEFIYEYAVSYSPRSIYDGKKMNIKEGLRVLYSLLRGNCK